MKLIAEKYPSAQLYRKANEYIIRALWRPTGREVVNAEVFRTKYADVACHVMLRSNGSETGPEDFEAYADEYTVKRDRLSLAFVEREAFVEGLEEALARLRAYLPVAGVDGALNPIVAEKFPELFPPETLEDIGRAIARDQS